jgi:SAM-dependent methyltransferase
MRDTLACMSWFSETKTIPSEKNGVIVATRRWGRWQVTVDGCEQTGREVHAMWEHALAEAVAHRGIQPVKNVLMLGLGGGGEIKNIYEHFPGAKLTVVEYDPAMIELARSLSLYRPFPFPRIICENAAETLAGMSEKFDLVIVDIFKGPEPSPLITDRRFLDGLRRVLADAGLLLVNAYRRPEYLEFPRPLLTQVAAWRFQWNHLGLYIKNAEGTEGFLPKDEWPKADPVAAMPAFLRPAYVGGEPRGMYWRFWPATFELYRGDREPQIAPLPPALKAPLRIITWQRLARSDTPEGWRSFSQRPYRMIGFAPVSEDYEKRWSENARRSRRLWLNEHLGKKYAVEEADAEGFITAYLKGALPYFMKQDLAAEIRSRARGHEPMSFWLARRTTDDRMLGGIAVLHSSEAKSSYYLGGFHMKEAEHDPVIPGLFDHWCKDALSRGERFIDFGNFWKPGEPSSWKGFSRFKAKFGPSYFFYKPMLYRFLRG